MVYAAFQPRKRWIFENHTFALGGGGHHKAHDEAIETQRLRGIQRNAWLGMAGKMEEFMGQIMEKWRK